MLEAEIVTQCHINDLDGHGNELPAFVADIRLVAARSNVIVIRQIDIETQLFRNRLEGGGFPKRFTIAGIRAVYWPNLKSRGHET